jgi:CheY-like chemotaxis protein
MEFLLFPACGLVLTIAVFFASQTISRRFAFVIFWLLGAISFIMSILTFLIATPEERLIQEISYHNIFAAFGYIAIVISAIVAQGRERRGFFLSLMEERQLRASSEITQLAASNSNLLELLNYSLDKIVTMLGLAGGAIHVFHRAKENLVLGAYKGLSPRLARRIETVEFGETSIGRAAKNKRLLIIRDLRLSQDYEFFGGKQDGFSYMALVPIVSDGENWGVITLFGQGAYQPGSLQVDLLEQFGEQLGAALVLGRRVRNIESSRDNFSALLKALGEELCDTSSVQSGKLGSARGVGWLVARFFGGDRFDLCSHDADGWKIVLSSESGADSRRLHPMNDSDFANLNAGLIAWDQEPPFDEFMTGKSYIYASLADRTKWFFVRLEGRRKSPVDFELLTDSFRIVYGLYARFAAFQTPIIDKQPIMEIKPALVTPQVSSALGQISSDLEKLIADYSGSRRESDLRELFAWLEVIKHSAEDNARHVTKQVDPVPPRPEANSFEGIIKSAIDQMARTRGGSIDIVYENENGVPPPDLPLENVKKSVVEFLSSALFDVSSKGTLKLSTKGGNGAIQLELKGDNLAPAPKSGERPAWLRNINGRVECMRIENERGQSVDTWRLIFPLKSDEAQSGSTKAETIKILAVDSQEVIRELLKSMLSSLGYDSTVVGDPDEAFDLFKSSLESGQPYTHVIADYSLGKVSGLKLAAELRLLDPNIFFLLISGWGLTPDNAEAAKAGIDMMIEKPFRMEQLAEIIAAATKRAAI